MKTKTEIRRNKIEEMCDMIDEFRYRQVQTTYQFEKKCRRFSQPIRQKIVSAFEYNANEMAEHGFYSHYRTYFHQELKPMGFHRDEADAIALVYIFKQPIERERFLAHIMSGSVEKTPDLFNLHGNPRFKKLSIADMRHDLLEYQYQTAAWWGSQINVLRPLSGKKPAEKQAILAILKDALSTARDGNVSVAVDRMTDGLMPYFFKESTPYLEKKASNDIALYAGFYARREKFFRVGRWVRAFSWLFLTQPRFDMYGLLDEFANSGRKIKRQAIRTMPDNQHQR